MPCQRGSSEVRASSTVQASTRPAGMQTRLADLFKVASDGEGLVSEAEVACDGDAVLADHCDARTLFGVDRSWRRGWRRRCRD